MKRIILPILVVALSLAGCSAAQTSTSSSNVDPNARTLPPVTQLVVGIFRLEGTPNAVTAQQAAGLLPMWQVYQSMYQSDTAAQEEVDALVRQIQEALTKEQMQAIRDMNLTQQDFFSLMQQQGIEMAGPAGQNMSAGQIATLQALRASGTGGQGGPSGMPAGGPMPGGGMPGGGPMDGGMPGGSGGAQAAGTQAAGSQPRAGMLDRVPAAVLDALIELLKARAAS